MNSTWQLNKNGFKRNLPYYEVHHNGNYRRFSGKTKAINYAQSIGRNLFNPNNNDRIDIVNTQTGQIYRYQ